MKRQITITIDDNQEQVGVHLAAEGMSEGEIMLHLSKALNEVVHHAAKFHTCSDPKCETKYMAAVIEKHLINLKREIESEHDIGIKKENDNV